MLLSAGVVTFLSAVVTIAWDDGWTLSDAIALAEDIRRYDGIDCAPQEIYEIMREFREQDAGDEE